MDGKVEKRERFTPQDLTPDPKVFHWIDLDCPTPEEAHLLEDPFHFHPLAIEDCLVDLNYPKVDDYDAYIQARESGMDTFDALEEIGQPGLATTTTPFESLQNKNVDQQSAGG